MKLNERNKNIFNSRIQIKKLKLLMSLRLIDIKTEIYIEITIEKMKIIIEYGQPTRIMRRKPNEGSN